jgi:predicted DNA-binding ribbon-helix-helix protein
VQPKAISVLRSSQAAVLGVALLAACSAPGRAVDLKPKTFPLTILGVEVGIPVTISFDAATQGDALVLQVRAHGDLRDIQDKALTIARAIPVPTDNCARTGVNPVVNSIDDASIAAASDTAVVTISGHVTAWICERPFNLTTKTILAADSATVSAPIKIVVLDQHEIGLNLAGPVTVSTGHALTAEVANLLAGDISGSLTAALTGALNASQARASLPTLPGLDATVQSAAFAADGANLLVNAAGTARMNGEAFNKLLEFMGK